MMLLTIHTVSAQSTLTQTGQETQYKVYIRTLNTVQSTWNNQQSTQRNEYGTIYILQLKINTEHSIYIYNED